MENFEGKMNDGSGTKRANLNFLTFSHQVTKIHYHWITPPRKVLESRYFLTLGGNF